jgi:hypothetical protein
MVAALVYSDGSNAVTVTPPANWTTLRGGAVGRVGFYTFWKFADSADVAAASFTFSFSASAVGYAFILPFTGVDTTAPFGFTHDTAGSTTTPSDPGTTGNGLQPMLVQILGYDYTTGRSVSGYQVANTNPAWTEQLDSGQNICGLAVATAPYTLTTASGTAQATISGAINSNDLQILALNTPYARASILSAASSLIAPTVIHKVAVTIVGRAFSLIAPTVSTTVKKWSNTAKSVTTSWTNTPKS